MHDLKFIRENPTAFDEGMKKRGLPPQSPQILKLDEEKRARQKELEELLAKRNQFAKSIGQAKAKGEDTTAIMAESKALNDRVAQLEAENGDQGELAKLLAALAQHSRGRCAAGQRRDRQQGNPHEHGAEA